mgnify:CR=1 FL=1
MKSLQDLDIFVRTVDSGSLSATARALDLTPAAASAALKRLEAELGVLLFVRSTRSLRLTQQGEQFLDAGGVLVGMHPGGLAVALRGRELRERDRLQDLLGVQRHKFGVAHDHAPAFDPARRLDHPHHRQCHRTLPRARLTDEAKFLTGSQIQVHPIQGSCTPRIGVVGYLEILYL